jgi:hypothetical protein
MATWIWWTGGSEGEGEGRDLMEMTEWMLEDLAFTARPAVPLLVVQEMVNV